MNKNFLRCLMALVVSLSSLAVLGANPIKVGVLLPLHNDNGDGFRMVEYYRGLLFAIDSLKQEGVSVELTTHNVKEGANIDSVLQKGDLANSDIIFGPLYSKQVSSISMLSKLKGAKMVIPFSINTPELNSNPNLFQVYQSPEELEDAVVTNFMKLSFKSNDCQVIIIDCNDSTSFRKPTFTTKLKAYCDKQGIAYRITNVLQTDKAFVKAFAKKKTNLVVLNSASSPKMLEVFARLNMVREKNEKLKFKVLGYTEWLMYEKFQFDNFCKNDVYIPSTYYYRSTDPRVVNMENKYRFWFKQDVQFALPRFVLTGFDQGYYFLKGMAKYGKNFVGSANQKVNDPIQTPLHFKKVSATGGYKNNDMMFVHYRNDKALELINY
ncbi:MAG: peptidoglycan-binding protein LysM [Prevotellaceae bacterium]|nr:peptidoglycan-binding protein LysM [Prevotellaceae bacterium]